MTDLFHALASGFTEQVYLVLTRAQGILWSLADILIVFAFLKIADLARGKGKGKRILYRYLFLGLSACLTPLLLLCRTSRDFFLLECIICGIQFSILLYSLIAEWKNILDFLGDGICDHRTR